MTGVPIPHTAAQIPRLDGALCAGRSDLFDQHDDPDRERIEGEALRLCAACPALHACRRWFDSLSPRDRPAGVVAGKVCRRRFDGKASPSTPAAN